MHSMTPEGVSARNLDGLDVMGDRPVMVDTQGSAFAWCNTAAVAEMGAEA